MRAHQANKRPGGRVLIDLADGSCANLSFWISRPVRTKSKPNAVGSVLRGGARERMRANRREARRERTLRRRRPHGQVVKTAASHAVNVGSNPAGVTKLALDKCERLAYNSQALSRKRANDAHWLFSSLTGKKVGVDYREGPPVPIPNTEVKLVCADDSMWVTACENR